MIFVSQSWSFQSIGRWSSKCNCKSISVIRRSRSTELTHTQTKSLRRHCRRLLIRQMCRSSRGMLIRRVASNSYLMILIVHRLHLPHSRLTLCMPRRSWGGCPLNNKHLRNSYLTSWSKSSKCGCNQKSNTNGWWKTICWLRATLKPNLS